VTRRFFTLIHKSIGRNLLRLADTTGATIVEFSISAALFFTMLFGVMVMSIAFYSYHYISEASREGARFAAVHGSTAATYGHLTVATAGTIQAYVQSLGFPGIQSSNMTVTTYWSIDGSNWSATSTNKNLAGDYVKVNVSYQLPVSIPFLLSNTLTMNSSAVGIISD